MEYKLRKAEPRDVPDILRLVKVGRKIHDQKIHDVLSVTAAVRLDE